MIILKIYDRRKIFGENLRDIRTRLKLSRKEVADKINMTEIAYGNYERGQRSPEIEKICELANLLGVTPNDLLNYQMNPFDFSKSFWQSKGFIVDVDNSSHKISLYFPPNEHEENDDIVTPNGNFAFSPDENKILPLEDKEIFIELTKRVYNQLKQLEQKNCVDITQKYYDKYIQNKSNNDKVKI